MANLKDKNLATMQDNKLKVRDLEEFYVNGTIEDITSKLEELKNEKVLEMIEYANNNLIEKFDKDGNLIFSHVNLKPIVISNYFFKSICPLGNKIPNYNAEKLSILFDYYLSLIMEINDKIGTFPPSLSSFCKLAGITTSTLRNWKNSSDIEMRNIVEKIYDQLGDDNLTMAQIGQVNEKSTMFKLKAQHEMVEKAQPNVNITYKQVVNTDMIDTNLKKYQDLLSKKDK